MSVDKHITYAVAESSIDTIGIPDRHQSNTFIGIDLPPSAVTDCLSCLYIFYLNYLRIQRTYVSQIIS